MKFSKFKPFLITAGITLLTMFIWTRFVRSKVPASLQF